MLRPKRLIFDVNETLLDLGPLNESVGEALGGRPDSAALWFATLLQEAIATTVADRFVNFDELGAACLRMLAKGRGLELGAEDAARRIAPLRSLPPHPDVIPALERLRELGFNMAVLSNSSSRTLADQLKNAGLTNFLKTSLSVEEIGLYKPHARVYRWAARRLEADVADCLMIAAHGWDVAGAAWAGLKTAFVARPGRALSPIGPPVDFEVASLLELAEALSADR